MEAMRHQVKIWEYCPPTACLFFILELAADQGPVSARIARQGASENSLDDRDNAFNSSVLTKWLSNSLLELRGTLILPPGTALEEFDLVGRVGDKSESFRLSLVALGAGCPALSAGLMARSSLPDGAERFDYWSLALDTPLEAAGESRAPDTCRALAGGGYCLSATVPAGTDSVTTAPTGGLRQSWPPKGAKVGSETPADPALTGFKNRHAGETAWLIGNGPSVRSSDLDQLEGKLTFAFNRFHMAYDDTRLRPTYTLSGDRQVIDDFGEDIVANAEGTVFFADAEQPTLAGDYVWLRQESYYPSLFSRDAAAGVTTGGSSVYVALQLGYFMGIRRFYLYGADFAFTLSLDQAAADPYRAASGDNNHFIPGYRAGQAWCPPDYRFIANSFWLAQCLLGSEGGFIRNATHGGRLEIFDRVPFNAALDGQPADTALHAAALRRAEG